MTNQNIWSAEWHVYNNDDRTTWPTTDKGCHSYYLIYLDESRCSVKPLYQIGKFDNQNRWSCNACMSPDLDNCVTHWCELPPPPESEE